MSEAAEERRAPIPRSSKISNALKKNFIDSITKDGLSIRMVRFFI